METQTIKVELSESYVYWQCRKALKEELAKPKHTSLKDLPKLFKEVGLEVKLKNKIHEICKAKSSATGTVMKSRGLDIPGPLPPLPPFFTEPYFEPLGTIERAGRNWSELLRRRLCSLTAKQEQPFLRSREAPWVWAKPVEVPAREEGDDSMIEERREEIDFIYDARDMLGAIQSIRSENMKLMGTEWGSLNVHLYTPSLDALRAEYEDLGLEHKQIGIDDERPFYEERLNLCESRLSEDYIPELQKLARRGIPPSLRGRVYSRILECSVGSKESEYFEFLLEQAMRWELSLDLLIEADTRQTCNEEQYFLFQENLEKMMFCFYRDSWVGDNLSSLPSIPLMGQAPDGKKIGKLPPAGMLPCKSFSLLAAPFTYLSEQMEESYYIFRSFYCRYFCFVHSLTSDYNGIISLCRLFEDLLQTFESELVYNLDQIGISPIKIAFPWIFYCFAGFIDVEQVLLLWDRIIGFDGLAVVAVFAASIFSYRADMLKQCTSQEEVDDLFADMQHIKVVPILQDFLFLNPKGV
mmetsp:Transcript_28954/g.51761  ORF Transcript_28954/g.51761 Transcript_28954/m.51761 type:complete len:524 (+) Transcript_28954:94-1665(+)